jgi:hypothetical protein
MRVSSSRSGSEWSGQHSLKSALEVVTMKLKPYCSTFTCFCRVGIDNPTIELRFENLNIEAEAYVGSRAVPTFINFFSNKIMVWYTRNSAADVVDCTAALILMKLLRQGVLSSLHIVPSGKKTISILRDVSGIVRPSRYICELF